MDTKTGEVTVSQAYSAPVRVTVAGALPRTDIGVHPVSEETVDGHDTAIKAAVTDGMKRAFRGFGVQFRNGFYGDQQPVSGTSRPQAVPVDGNGRSSQSQANRRNGSQAQAGRNGSKVQTLRKRLVELAREQGFDEAKVRAAVKRQTGKALDDLAADELETLVEAAAAKVREMKQAQSLPRT